MRRARRNFTPEQKTAILREHLLDHVPVSDLCDEVVKNANLVERDPEANGIDRIVGLERIDPENLHIWRWNSVADGSSFTRKFLPGQTLFGKRRAYSKVVADMDSDQAESPAAL